ncbi:MAG: hypothetical protein ACIAQ0_05555, partial [Phycisphaerales bacterium JB058]
ETGRMENLPRDFRVLAGGVFTNLLASLSESEREAMYLAAPNELRQYAYWILERELSETMNERAAAGEGRPFNEVFPPPIGIDQFRLEMEALRQQQQRDYNIDIK